MSGANTPVLNLPPGIFSNGTQYSVGQRWFTGNQVRWYKNSLSPVGGWVKTHTFAATQSIRDMFSWRDYLKAPWGAAGSADKLFSMEIFGPGAYTVRDITPVGLVWTVPTLTGYGSGTYGSGFYGLDSEIFGLDNTALWSMDNFGRNLFAVHSQDGRLFVYDPTTPTTPAIVQTGAPTNNTLVLSTEEEHLMLFGGDGNPRRIVWCSQRDPTDWDVTETNSAGELELQSDGSILSATRVQGGILVLTDTDAHMIEYLGPPFYYGRRRLSEESTCLGKNCVTSFGNSAMWMGTGNFWRYDGNIREVPCDIHDEVFYNSNLKFSSRIVMTTNQYAQEVWISYPGSGHNEPDRYASMGFTDPSYWSKGDIPRTAWLNPVWTDKPLACNGLDLYEHETGWLADGVSRIDNIFAETGAFELGEGDQSMRVDRIWPDVGVVTGSSGHVTADLTAVTMTFKLRQSPNGTERIYGPISLDNTRGYKTVRFRARQAYIRVTQNKNDFWVVGKVRMRTKPGGFR